MTIKDSVVLVSGANRGIGKALVEALTASRAGKIYAGYRNAADPSWASDGRIVPLRLDITSPDDVRRAAESARDVTLLVNNAGVLTFGDILTVDEESIRRDMDVNFYGLLRMVRTFTPVLRENRGTVVNILTLVSLVSAPGMAAYCASKAAAWSLALSLRGTVEEYGITVKNVFPGGVDTDMLAGVDAPKTSPGDVAAGILRGIESEEADVFPDPMSQSVYAQWRADHKAVERQFASM